MPIAASDLTRKEALLAELARDLKNPPARVPAPASDPVLAKFNALGTQLWLDTGNLDEASKLWRHEMSALTTNNTLANQVVQTGIMDDEISEVAKRVKDIEPGISLDELVLDTVFVVNCQIALRLVSAFGALVSVELHPGSRQRHRKDVSLRPALLCHQPGTIYCQDSADAGRLLCGGKSPRWKGFPSTTRSASRHGRTIWRLCFPNRITSMSSWAA